MTSPDEAELLARLTSPVPQVRYEACRELAVVPSMSGDAARALLVALVDTGSGVESSTDAAGDPLDYAVPIATAATRALSAHAERHLPLLREAFDAGGPELRARLVSVVPLEEPWQTLFDALADVDPRVRLAAVARLADATASARVEWVEPYVAGVTDAECDRLRPLVRARFVAVLDADGAVASAAARAVPHPPRGPARDAAPGDRWRCAQRAADVITRDEPDVVAALCDRLRDAPPIVAADVAAMLGWFRGRSEVAEAVAQAILSKPEDRLLLDAAATSLERVGTLLAQPTLERLIQLLGRPVPPPPSLALIAAVCAYGSRAGAAAPAVLAEMARRAGTPFDDVRRHARLARSLGSLGEGAWALCDRLVGLFRGPDPVLGGMVAMALGELGDHAEDVVPLLAEALRGGRTERMHGALLAAARLGVRAAPLAPDLIPILEPGLRHGRDGSGSASSRDLYEAACAAVAAIGREAMVTAPVLARLVQDDEAASGALPALEALAPLPEETVASLREVWSSGGAPRSYSSLVASSWYQRLGWLVREPGE